MIKIQHYSVVALFLFLFSCSGKFNDAERSGLVGRVKSFTEFRCDPLRSDESWVAGESLSDEYRKVYFDKNGNFMESFTLNAGGDTLVRSTCVRKDGEMVEEIFFSRIWHDPNNPIMMQTSKTVYERVSEKQVNFESYRGDRRAFEGANFYDSKQRLIRQVQVRGEMEETMHYIYDKQLLVENYKENMSGQRIATQLYEYGDYDKLGNWRLMLIYAAEDKIVPDLAIKRIIEYH